VPNQRGDGKAFLGWWALSAVVERLEALAERRGITKTDALNEAVTGYLDQQEAPAAPVKEDSEGEQR
jgi:hypothetical protein